MGYPQKVDVKTCLKKIPPHPCDGKPPCDPEADPEGDCVKPFLCFERLKNPETPALLTRCKSGASIGVRNCMKPPPPHPCDTPIPCDHIPEPRRQVCDEPPLCQHRILNPEVGKLRRVLCIDSKGNITEKKVTKQ